MASKKPPITADVALGRLEHGSYWIVGNRAAITPAFVRELLARDCSFPRHTMLKLAVPLDSSDDELMRRWNRAADALRGLDLTYAWGSKELRARVRELARDPEILAAIQGVVGLTESPPATMLAVLVADGGDASIDALIPHLGGALESRDSRLDWLRRLRTHAARTPRLDALFAELDATYDKRNATSPALALGPIIGIGEPTSCGSTPARARSRSVAAAPRACRAAPPSTAGGRRGSARTCRSEQATFTRSRRTASRRRATMIAMTSGHACRPSCPPG